MIEAWDPAIQMQNRQLYLSVLRDDGTVRTFPRNSLTAEQRRMNQAMAQICRFVATSELPSWLTAGRVGVDELGESFGRHRIAQAATFITASPSRALGESTLHRRETKLPRQRSAYPFSAVR